MDTKHRMGGKARRAGIEGGHRAGRMCGQGEGAEREKEILATYIGLEF